MEERPLTGLGFGAGQADLVGSTPGGNDLTVGVPRRSAVWMSRQGRGESRLPASCVYRTKSQLVFARRVPCWTLAIFGQRGLQAASGTLTAEITGRWRSRRDTVCLVPELTMDELENRISALRGRIRRALADGDRAKAAALRAELREAEFKWDSALLEIDAAAAVPAVRSLPRSASFLPMREQVHQVLTVLGVPAAPKLIVAVHEAFFSGELVSAKLTSLRRDEERSFRSAPHARPYYLCSALSADRLTAVRGLLAVSTWPLDRRMIGSLSPRVDFLDSAIRLAEHVERTGQPGPKAARLLWRFATNIPHAAGPFDSGMPEAVIAAARAELEVHDEADRAQREAAAERASRQLDEVRQMFGAEPLSAVRRAPSTG
jgi:hypothetical protein